MEKENIVTLVEAAQAGSSDAISELFAAYKNEVYSIAIRETKDRALSDDIVQETFVEVILKIKDLKNPESFHAWLKIMAYHQCTRHYKKKETVHETAAVENDEGWSVFDTVEETNASFVPDEALDQKEFKATILEMIADLPDAQRTALHMFYFEEMPLKDIAAAQGVSVNTANTRLNRGRLAMKDSIEKYEKKHGIRLHTIAFFPFFKWLLKGSDEAMSTKSATKVAQKISAETGVSIATTQASVAASATAASGKTAVTTGTKVVAAGIWTKVVAGVAAVSIAISAPFVASQIEEEQDDSYLQNTTISDTQYISHETLQSTPEIIPEETIVTTRNPSLEYYAPVFEQYQMAMNNDFYFDPNGMPVQSNNPQEYLSFLLSMHSRFYRNYCNRHYHENLYDEDYHVYYCLLDLNNDDIDELFIGAGENVDYAAIYSLFSYDGTKPIRLADEGSLGERSCMTVYEDNTFVIYGSGGAFYSGIWHYRLPQNSLIPETIEEYKYDNGKYYWKDSVGNARDITQDEFASAMNHEGKYVKQLDWQEIVPEEVINNAESGDISLQDHLDISQSWGIRKDVSSSPDYPMEQVFDFAFMEDGTCFCFFYQQYTDFFASFHGTYSFTDNHITFDFGVYGEESRIYVYSFDPLTLQLTQVSEKGFWGASVGTKYYLVNDAWYPTAHDIITAVNNSIDVDTQGMGG